MHEAVRHFFEERERCATRLAAEHRRCRDGLRAFNIDMQCADQDGAFSISNFKNFLDGHGAGQPETRSS